MPIDMRTGLVTAAPTTTATNPRTSGAYNPYVVPAGGYGQGPDPYSTAGAAAGLATGTAEANLAAAPDIAKISNLINQLNAAQQQALNAARLGPQGQQIQANLLANVGRESAGLLDPQTEAMLQQGIAAGGAARGFGVDSANLAAAYRRALGQTIEGTEAQAQQQYLGLLAANPAAPLYSAAESLVTPSQFASTAAAQAQRQLEQQRLAQQQYEFDQQMQLQRQALAARLRPTGGYGGGVAGGLPPASPITATAVTGPADRWYYAGGDGNVPGAYIPANIPGATPSYTNTFVPSINPYWEDVSAEFPGLEDIASMEPTTEQELADAGMF